MKALSFSLIVIGLVCVFGVVAIRDSQAMELDESLVLYLPFDGNDPEDMSQYGHDVELVGNPDRVEGKYGNAYEVSVSNYVKVPITDTLQLREKFEERKCTAGNLELYGSGWNPQMGGYPQLRPESLRLFGGSRLESSLNHRRSSSGSLDSRCHAL